MSARVAKLQALLERVQQRAGEPRPIAAAAAAVEVAAEAESAPLELDEPGESVLPPPQSEEGDSLLPDSLDSPSAPEISELDFEDEPRSGATVGNLQDESLGEPHPPMTPPPESGEAVTNPHIPTSEGPTPEQLGATISLEEATNENLELDEPMPVSVDSEAQTGEFEADFTSSPVNPQLISHDSSLKDLERVRLGEETPVEARISRRPVTSTNVVDFLNASKDFRPKSLSELLDASLKLK